MTGAYLECQPARASPDTRSAHAASRSRQILQVGRWSSHSIHCTFPSRSPEARRDRATEGECAAYVPAPSRWISEADTLEKARQNIARQNILDAIELHLEPADEVGVPHGRVAQDLTLEISPGPPS